MWNRLSIMAPFAPPYREASAAVPFLADGGLVSFRRPLSLPVVVVQHVGMTLEPPPRLMNGLLPHPPGPGL